jgi:hypothetical protein
VARDLGLGKFEHVDDVADAQLTRQEQMENAQSHPIGKCAKHFVDRNDSVGAERFHICLSVYIAKHRVKEDARNQDLCLPKMDGEVNQDDVSSFPSFRLGLHFLEAPLRSCEMPTRGVNPGF